MDLDEIDYRMFKSLLKRHRYTEAADEARRLMDSHHGNIGPIECLAEALFASGDYSGALPYLAQVDQYARSDNRVPGQSGRRIWMSCAHWMLGERDQGIRLMAEMTNGILDGSIEFGDAAGAVQQGLLLYYMGISANNDSIVSNALAYLRTRVKQRTIKLFPGSVAQYHLGESEIRDVFVSATDSRVDDIAGALAVARTDLLCRRHVCVALFHSGVRARALGDETCCQERMGDCFSLENPLLEPEWYLARHEVQSQH